MVLLLSRHAKVAVSLLPSTNHHPKQVVFQPEEHICPQVPITKALCQPITAGTRGQGGHPGTPTAVRDLFWGLLCKALSLLTKYSEK